MLHQQFDELKLTGCLPSPTGVGLAVLQQTQNDDYTLGDLSRTLAADPTLTGRILRLANSSANSGVEVARTAHQAAVRLGARTVRNVALGFTLVSGHRTGNCRNFDYDHYWSHSLAIAVAAQVLATRVPKVVPSEAFTFGLLSGIGRLALASIHSEAYARILDRVPDYDGLALARAELESFGLNHGQLAAAMFADWRLPDDFVQAELACTETPSEDELEPSAQRLVGLFHSARALADALLTTDADSVALCRARNERMAALRSQFSLSPEEFAQIWSVVAADWREWGKLMNIDATSSTTPTRLTQLAERNEHVATAAAGAADAAMDEPAAAEQRIQDARPADEVVQAPRTEAEAPGSGASDPARGPSAPSAPRPTLISPIRDDQAASTHMRVLVVEDDAVSRKLISFHLAKEGHEVYTAADGRLGLQLALERLPHLVVTDWMMPELDGIELVRALRRSDEGRHMQVILLTGREEEARVIEAFDAGADEYLTKPLNPRILMARVRSAQRVVGYREQITRDAEARNAQLGELAVLNRKLGMAALTDPLTGLPNRRCALERMQQELAISVREGTPLSVILIDIDRFKSVNDEFGHDTGDAVLREVANSLRACIRATELVCRLGGEEFLVICPRANLAKAALIAERMRLASEARVIEHGEFRRAVTLSLGVAELDRANPNVDRLIKIADERTYQAKQAGRNRVISAPPNGGTTLRATG